MEIYILIVLFFGINAIVQKKISIFLVLLLILVAGFRSEFVGIDTEGYKRVFTENYHNILLGQSLLKFEPLWVLLGHTLNYLNYGFQSLVLTTSVLVIYPIYFVCKKSSKHPSLSMLLYVMLFYYFLSFSLIRQFIAISFIMLGLYYKVEKTSKLSILYFTIAFLFHYSSIFIIALIYFTNKINVNKKYLLLILVATFTLGLMGGYKPFMVIFEYIPILKYSNYADYKSDTIQNNLNMYLFLVPQNIMAYFILKKTNISFYFVFFLIGITSINLFLPIPLFSRLVYYFLIFEILLIPNLLVGIKNINNRRLIISLIFIYGLSYFIYYLSTNRAGIIPYSIFNY